MNLVHRRETTYKMNEIAVFLSILSAVVPSPSGSTRYSCSDIENCLSTYEQKLQEAKKLPLEIEGGVPVTNNATRNLCLSFVNVSGNYAPCKSVISGCDEKMDELFDKQFDLGLDIKRLCVAACPTFLEIQKCVQIQDSEIDSNSTAFCRSYEEAKSCFQTLPANCFMADDVFNNRIPYPVKTVIHEYCRRDCVDVHQTIILLRNCTSDRIFTSGDCSVYQSLQTCLENFKQMLCSHYWSLLKYLYPEIQHLENNCSVISTATTSTTTAVSEGKLSESPKLVSSSSAAMTRTTLTTAQTAGSRIDTSSVSIRNAVITEPWPQTQSRTSKDAHTTGQYAPTTVHASTTKLSTTQSTNPSPTRTHFTDPSETESTQIHPEVYPTEVYLEKRTDTTSPIKTTTMGSSMVSATRFNTPMTSDSMTNDKQANIDHDANHHTKNPSVDFKEITGKDFLGPLVVTDSVRSATAIIAENPPSTIVTKSSTSQESLTSKTANNFLPNKDQITRTTSAKRFTQTKRITSGTTRRHEADTTTIPTAGTLALTTQQFFGNTPGTASFKHSTKADSTEMHPDILKTESNSGTIVRTKFQWQSSTPSHRALITRKTTMKSFLHTANDIPTTTKFATTQSVFKTKAYFKFSSDSKTSEMFQEVFPTKRYIARKTKIAIPEQNTTEETSSDAGTTYRIETTNTSTTDGSKQIRTDRVSTIVHESEQITRTGGGEKPIAGLNVIVCLLVSLCSCYLHQQYRWN